MEKLLLLIAECLFKAGIIMGLLISTVIALIVTIIVHLITY